MTPLRDRQVKAPDRPLSLPGQGSGAWGFGIRCSGRASAAQLVAGREGPAVVVPDLRGGDCWRLCGCGAAGGLRLDAGAAPELGRRFLLGGAVVLVAGQERASHRAAAMGMQDLAAWVADAWRCNVEEVRRVQFQETDKFANAQNCSLETKEGIHMTVDGKHVTSYAFREDLEPGFVGEVRVEGDIKLLSVLASGLATTEDFEHVTELEILKAPPVPTDKSIDIFIGIFSTENSFKRRMVVRRTWMQYDAVCSGKVAVRFFVGLHKNEVVNEELWNDGRTYGDIQLMPFVDYYSLILWKTIAICIYGTNVLSAKYVMKTDDDAFVRVDEILLSLRQVNISHGLLYGRVNSDSQPHRDLYSKWYITSEVFKLEDVAMGIWINEMKKEGFDVTYQNDGRILVEGCEDGYVVAHYQEPRQMMCLWDKFQKTK
ncbi:Beta-1,3-galactosyltransferase 15 [Hordeum vulgare]|nr:Beta-1,3-galactosyltransferase 15 [Hordeum vulgare]